MDNEPAEIKKIADQEAFNKVKGRVEACKKIKLALERKVGQARPPMEATLDQLEAESEQGEAGRLKGNQEVMFDVRGYQEA